MNEEKYSIDLDRSPELARLILDMAQLIARCKEKDTPAEQYKTTSEDVREAANLVFLSLDLIREYLQTRR